MFSQLCIPLRLLRLNYKAKMSVFTQKLNPILGENSWEWQKENYDYHQEIARSSFADMLHDTERNQKYFDALKVAIEKIHSMGKKAKVLDIGTGTGLLSMMAVRCGADSVVACEAFVPMSECAKEVLKLNGCSGKVKIVPKHSTDLTVGEHGDLSERANILVTEVFDTELIGEGALTTFSHAHKVLLEKDCIVVPNSATVYAQVVETPFAKSWNGFKNIYDDDGQLLIKAPDSIEDCQGAAAVHDIQLSQMKLESFREIISPIAVMHFDWSGKTSLEFNRNNAVTVKARCDGKAQVVFMWWELGMDTNDKIILSCAPFWAHPLKKENPNLTSADIPWRDHWMQALYYLPKEINVKRDEEYELVSCHDEFSWWFHLNVNKEKPAEECLKPICDCGFHLAHSRTRIGQINDHIRNKKYIAMLEKYINKESVVLLLSDGFYLGLAAAKLGAKKVLYLDDNYLSTRVLKEFINCNNLTNVEIIENLDGLQENENMRNVSLIFGQPYFSTTILPWDSLHFAYLINKIRKYVLPNVRIIPKIGIIKGIVVEFKDLQKIRLPLETCTEFNVTPFDELIMVCIIHNLTQIDFVEIIFPNCFY